MKYNKLENFNLKILQNQTQQYSSDNIEKLNLQSDFIKALEKKYVIFFNIINEGIQYKQFLSSFFNSVCNGNIEPFYINIIKNSKEEKKIFYRNTSNFNFITLLPWSNKNIVYSEDSVNLKDYVNSMKIKSNKNKIRITKEQFLKFLMILFPNFIKKFPVFISKKLLFNEDNTISCKKCGKYLIYCGDKLSKNYFNNKIYKKELLRKSQIYNFFEVFTNEQIKNILLQK